MIAEPYICIKGPRAGDIEWRDANDIIFKTSGIVTWVRYDQYEREKLRELGCNDGIEIGDGGFNIQTQDYGYCSWRLIGYSRHDYKRDSESSRLLKRAEFLKAVCEKEEVVWIKGKAQNSVMKCCTCDAPIYECTKCNPKRFHELSKQEREEARDWKEKARMVFGYFYGMPERSNEVLPTEEINKAINAIG